VNPAYDFSGQVALVTGESSGMGLATARPFAKAGPQSSSATSTRLRMPVVVGGGKPFFPSRRSYGCGWPSTAHLPQARCTCDMSEE
jgi:hypothetical protein